MKVEEIICKIYSLATRMKGGVNRTTGVLAIYLANI